MKNLQYFLNEDADSNLASLKQLTISKTNEKGQTKKTVHKAGNDKTVEDAEEAGESGEHEEDEKSDTKKED